MILPSPVRLKKPKEKVSRRKGSSMYMAALKRRLFANERQASMSTRALSPHKKYSVTAPGAFESRVDSPLPSPSSPLSSSSSSSSSSPLTLFHQDLRHHPIRDILKIWRYFEQSAISVCESTVELKKVQGTLHWMVRQGEYNLKFWPNYKNTAEKRFQETSKALRKARKSEEKWVRFVSTRRDLRRVVLTNS